MTQQQQQQTTNKQVNNKQTTLKTTTNTRNTRRSSVLACGGKVLPARTPIRDQQRVNKQYKSTTKNKQQVLPNTFHIPGTGGRR